MSVTIECRSSVQIDEDNVCELHNRLTKWMRELRNERCFDYKDIEWKRAQMTRLEKLIVDTEQVINGEMPLQDFNVWIVERLGIKYSSMLRY